MAKIYKRTYAFSLFPSAKATAGKYQNIKGLCKIATIDEVRKAGYSLNPGRYVGVTDNGNGDDGDFEDKIEKLHSELKGLTDEAHELEHKVFENLKKINY